MKHLIFLLSISIILIAIISCEETLGPNELGGDANLEYTQVGSEFGIYPDIENADYYLKSALQQIEDTVYVTKNDKGMVTFHMKFTFSEETFNMLDSAFGTKNLPTEAKNQIIDYFKDKYQLEIDTSDKEHISVSKEAVLKITADGFQNYAYSKEDLSKPFTIMKYHDGLGTKYEFTTDEGEKITRTVVAVHTTEDWQIGFLSVKTMRVEEETPNDPLISKITYIGNHKFGFVGVIIDMKDGKRIITPIIPWAVM